MAQISVLAQPGLTFMQSADAARQNRLAMAAAEAERATAESQQQLRQQAFQSLQTGQAGPEQVAAQLFGAGLTQEGTAALGMARAQEQARTAQERERQRIQGEESTIFTNAAQSGLEDLTPVRNRLRRIGSPLADAPEEELRNTFQAYSATTPQPNSQRFTAVNPATGQEEIAFVNPRTQEVTFSGIRAGTGEIGQLAGAVAGMAGAIAAGQTPEGRGARDQAVRAVSNARQSASTTLQTAREMIAAPEGAFGFRGNVTRDVTSVVEQMLGRGAAENVARAASGASLDELARIQVAAQIQVSQSIARITGEESGRISEAERELTTQVVGATQDLSTKSRAVQALAYLYPLEVAEVNRNMLLARGRLEYQFVTPDGRPNRDALIEHVEQPMLQAGFNEDDIRRAIASVMQITREQMGMHSLGAFVDE